MDLNPLINLGMNSKEALIYLTLLEESTTTAGKIADKTHLHRRTVYDLLNSLKEKGFVSYFNKNNVLNYSAVNPDLLLNIYKEKESAIKNILPELKLRQKHIKEMNAASVYQGIKAVKTIFEDILLFKEYNAFGEGMKTVEILGDFFDYFQEQKRKKHIKSKVLMNEIYRDQKTVTEASGEFKFLKEYSPPSLTYIYGNKVATIIWSEEPTGFLIESKEVAISYNDYFKALWKVAKE
jgi:sugar-specific transcriptional regulator TrmB